MSHVVGVNLLWLVPGVVGGSEEYTVRLLTALDDLAPADLRLRLYVRDELAEAHPGLVARFETVTAPRMLRAKAARVAVEHSWLAAATAGDALVHHPGGVVPAVRSTPTVVTVHDLQPLDLPANFSPAKRRWLAMMLPRSAAAARLVLTPSRFTADRIIARFGLEPARVRVVPHGHPALPAGPPPPDAVRRLAQRYGRYVLYPAIAYPHKRHQDLLDAFAALSPQHPDLSLVLTGGRGPRSNDIDAWCRSTGLDHRVHRLGRVPEAELDHLLRAADVVAIPSEYEGFGNPAVEAMVRGTPTVVSDAAALPEVVGDAALIVPAGNSAALAGAIRLVLDDPSMAADLRRRGPERAARFDERTGATALLDSYRDALDVPLHGFPGSGRSSAP